MSTFDSNHKKIITAFMTLKNKATILEKHTLNGNYQINKNRLPFIWVQNYYTHLRSVCDLPIVFMMNEEVSNVAARHLCPELLVEMLEEQNLTPRVQIDGKPAALVHEDFDASVADISALFSLRINSIVKGLMLNFTVSTFSCFEHWITNLYDGYAEKLEAAYEKSREDKVVNLLEQYCKSISNEERSKHLNRILAVRAPYRSFPDKINALYKMVDKQKYGRNINHDKQIITFLGACRNTVHNSGLHRNGPAQITCNGITYFLETDKPWNSNTYVETIALLGELADIYSHLIRALDDWPLEAICEEITLQPNMMNFEIAVQRAFESDEQTGLEYVLTDILAVGEVQAANIFKHLAEIKADTGRDPQEFCVYEILGGDLLKPLAT